MAFDSELEIKKKAFLNSNLKAAGLWPFIEMKVADILVGLWFRTWTFLPVKHPD